MPPLMNNHGNYIVSLGNVCRWLADQGRRTRRRDLSGLCRHRSALQRRRRGHRRRHRRHGHREERRARPELYPRHGAARQIYPDRRGRARLARQAADRQVRPPEGPRAAEIRHRPQGALAGEAREPQAGPGAALVRLAARHQDRRRLVPLSPGGQSRRRRLRRPPQLQEPLSLSLRGVPALQDASGDPRHLRGRQAPVLWCARHHRGRLPVGAEAVLPGRRADRLFGRFRQRAAHQGQPQCGAVRHAGGRQDRRGDCRGRANDEVDRDRERMARRATSART